MQFISLVPNRKFILYTNRKVLSTRLSEETKLRAVVPQPIQVKNRIATLGRRFYHDYLLRDYKKYLLVRHPMSKLESLYRHAVLTEKVIGLRLKHRKQELPLERPKILETSARALYGQRRAKQLTYDFQIHAWVSFRTWIESLPLLMQDRNYRAYFLLKEEHTRPQYLVLYPKYTRLLNKSPVPIRCDRLIKIEEEKDREFLENDLDFNLNHFKNRTLGLMRTETLWTPRMKEIVYDYYREDFLRFNYSI